uniref:DNA-directed DNA polymerase n=1 Tax=Angiostrongylus cantonensis TaxID=6313 RepID=A0A158PC16_ANGCA
MHDVSSSHSQSDDAVPYSSCLRNQVFLRELTCECAYITRSQHASYEVLPGADCVLREDMVSYTYLGDRNHDTAGESCLVWRDVYDKIVKDLEKKPNELEQYQFNITKAEEVMLHNKCRRVELSPMHPLMTTSHIQGPWCYVTRKDKIMAVNCFDACEGEPREEDVHPGLAVNKALAEIANAIPIPAPIGPQKRYSNIPYCTTPQTVRDCYATYLEKYGIHSGPYYLPEYSRLEQQLKTMPLTNICRDFEELLSCLRLVSFDCISIPVFERFTQWYGKVNEESVAYVQNHAFLEFACGVGKAAFLANHDCLSRAFNVQSLTQRINNCLPSDSDMCT